MNGKDLFLGDSLQDQYDSAYAQSTAASFSQSNVSHLAYNNRDMFDRSVMAYKAYDRYGYKAMRNTMPDVRFSWNGWSADLHSLSMAGWQISTHWDMCTQSNVVSMLLPRRALSLANTNPVTFRGNLEPVAIDADVYYSRDIRMAFRIDDYSRTRNTASMTIPAPLDEFVIRRWEYQQRSPEIIVPKETVGDLLERITTMQQDARIERIRAKLRENSVDVPLPDMTNVTVIG